MDRIKITGGGPLEGVIPISGAFANCPLDLASDNFFSVGGSVFELLSTSAITKGKFYPD